MEMVIRFDFEAETKNFALLQSLHFKVNIVPVLLNSQPGGEHPCYFLTIIQKGQMFNTLAFSSHEKEWIFDNRIFPPHGMGKYLMV